MRSSWLAAFFTAMLIGGASTAAAEADGIGFERTPPRLAYAEGEVSFWRPGADEWAPAYLNTALAPGDELFAGAGANVELQIGARAFVRAAEQTQLGLVTQEPDYLQLRLTTGTLALDLRELGAGDTFEIGTPHAVFTIEEAGYYRVEVAGEETAFTSRRSGSAELVTVAGQRGEVGAGERVLVTGTGLLRVETFSAPPLDDWDRWSYARTEQVLESESTRYVSDGIYGVSELDRHGRWEVVPTYGPVWYPRRVAVGWAPYTTGRWQWDPYYGWTWVDEAVWGWAPYHYGRWVRVRGYWAWAPGPRVVRVRYAPALVAFFGGGGFSFGFTVGGAPSIGWVALGWGEPCVPWWGPVGFVGTPHWFGWGGPRVVNRVVVHHTTVVDVHHIHSYEHAHDGDAVVVVNRDRFGRGRVRDHRPADRHLERLAPARGALPVKTVRAHYTGGEERAKRPPREIFERRVVATRMPRDRRGDEARRFVAPEPRAAAVRPARTAPAEDRRQMREHRREDRRVPERTVRRERTDSARRPPEPPAKAEPPDRAASRSEPQRLRPWRRERARPEPPRAEREPAKPAVESRRPDPPRMDRSGPPQRRVERSRSRAQPVVERSQPRPPQADRAEPRTRVQTSRPAPQRGRPRASRPQQESVERAAPAEEHHAAQRNAARRRNERDDDDARRGGPRHR